MKKILFISFALMLFLSCRHKAGSGNIISQQRSPGDFTALAVSGDFDVDVKNGPTNVIINADDNIMESIKSIVKNGELRISVEGNLRNTHLSVSITAPEINSVKASSSASIITKDVLHASEMEMHASSGSSIQANIDAPKTILHASSGGKLIMMGRTKNLEAESSSGSDIEAGQLMSEQTIAHASSGGILKVHASIDLDAEASSGGKVLYTGPARIKQSVSSGGSVTKE